MRYPITTGKQTRSTAGAFTGSLDVSTHPAATNPPEPFTIYLTVLGLPAAVKASIAIQDTANATPFSDALPVAVLHVQGEIQPGAPVEASWKDDRLPAARRGVANAAWRAYLLSISSAVNIDVSAEAEI